MTSDNTINSSNPLFTKVYEPLSTKDEEAEIAKEFETLAALVSKLPRTQIDLANGVHELHKDALAFLVDAYKRVHGDQWKFIVQGIEQQLLQIIEKYPPEQAEVEATWLLNKAIFDLYMLTIQSEIKKAEELKDPKKAEMFLRICNLNIRFQKNDRIAHERGERVSFGGIDRTLLPEWYKQKYVTQ